MMVIRLGLSSGKYENFSIYDESTENKLPLSDNLIDEINKEAREIVERVYKSTKELLSKDENKAKIDIVAKTLLKKKIVSARELKREIDKL